MSFYATDFCHQKSKNSRRQISVTATTKKQYERRYKTTKLLLRERFADNIYFNNDKLCRVFAYSFLSRKTYPFNGIVTSKV